METFRGALSLQKMAGALAIVVQTDGPRSRPNGPGDSSQVVRSTFQFGNGVGAYDAERNDIERRRCFGL